MDHSYFKDKISAYFDGALEAQERELIRRHLVDCEVCRKILEELRHLNETIEKHSGINGDEYFEKLAQNIDKRIAQPDEKIVDVRPFRWKPIIWKFSAAAASILLIGTIGYYQWFQDEELPERMLQSAQEPATVERSQLDSLADFEREDVLEESAGRRDSDLGKTGAVSEAETPKVMSKGEIPEEDVVRSLPRAQTVFSDSISADNAPKPSSQPPASETMDETGEQKAKEPEVDDFRTKSGGLSSNFAELTEDSLSEKSEAVQLNLKELLVQNQFLQSQIDQNIKGHASIRQLKEKKSSPMSFKSTAEAKVPDSIYQQLAVNWFQIAQITKDSVEKNQAIQYLNWYKVNFPVDSANANQYLKEITE